MSIKNNDLYLLEKYTVKSLYKLYVNNQLIYNMPYKRKLVWDNNKKNKLLKSINDRLDIGELVFNKQNDVFYVIDGKQRLTTLFENIKTILIYKLTLNIKIYNELNKQTEYVIYNNINTITPLNANQFTPNQLINIEQYLSPNSISTIVIEIKNKYYEKLEKYVYSPIYIELNNNNNNDDSSIETIDTNDYESMDTDSSEKSNEKSNEKSSKKSSEKSNINSKDEKIYKIYYDLNSELMYNCLVGRTILNTVLLKKHNTNLFLINEYMKLLITTDDIIGNFSKQENIEIAKNSMELINKKYDIIFEIIEKTDKKIKQIDFILLYNLINDELSNLEFCEKYFNNNMI